ncbi:hypothetical protein [Alterinioella nitratireducens]|uniref:hypothetical protein n=1 Tax=Alterinioella nitratireducens TaxID=2735915 RepID=UPI00155581C5|nr:hypothetical protein [Alterinioella nitratireducens]NPD18227.1 hypothetical protein [Alterinioella nitratireducens]
MNLSEFVKQTLLQITDGVADAQEEAKLFVAPGMVEGVSKTDGQLVTFEVAVTINAEGGGGISVLSFGELKGNVAKESVSRISFEVPVHFNAPTRANRRHWENDGPLNPVNLEEKQ